MLAFILILFIYLVFYFLPTILARDKKDFWAIMLLNLSFGWTGIGWIIAMIWSIRAESSYSERLKDGPLSIAEADKLIKLSELRSKGLVSQTEYEIQKRRILGVF